MGIKIVLGVLGVGLVWYFLRQGQTSATTTSNPGTPADGTDVGGQKVPLTPAVVADPSIPTASVPAYAPTPPPPSNTDNGSGSSTVTNAGVGPALAYTQVLTSMNGNGVITVINPTSETRTGRGHF